MKPSGRAREVAEALGLSRVTVGGPTRERRPKRAAPCRTLGEPRGVVRSRRDRYGQCVCLSVCTSMWLVLPGFSGFFCAIVVSLFRGACGVAGFPHI